MKPLVNIFILPFSPIVNIDKLELFENFNHSFSSLLYSTLYSNLIEVFVSTDFDYTVYPLFYFYDDGLIDDELIPNQVIKNIRLVNPNRIKISELYSMLDFQNNISIFVFSDTIGYSKLSVQKMINLLKNEDEMIVIAKHSDGNITHFGLNGPLKHFISTSEMSELNSALKTELVSDRFLYLIDGVYPIRNFNDFKDLYRLLSIKENFYFCSLDIHKQFNHLFIEYKEMLK